MSFIVKNNLTQSMASAKLTRRSVINRAGKLGVGSLLPLTGGVLFSTASNADIIYSPPPGNLIWTTKDDLELDIPRGRKTITDYAVYYKTGDKLGSLEYVTANLYKRKIVRSMLTGNMLGQSYEDVYCARYAPQNFFHLDQFKDGRWQRFNTLGANELEYASNDGCRNDERRLQVSRSSMRAWLATIVSTAFMNALKEDPLVYLPKGVSYYAHELFYITFSLVVGVNFNGNWYPPGLYHVFFSHARGVNDLTKMQRSYFVHKATDAAAVVAAADKAIEEFNKYSAAITATLIAKGTMAASVVSTSIFVGLTVINEYAAPYGAGIAGLVVTGAAGTGVFYNEREKAFAAARSFAGFMSTIGVTSLNQQDPLQCPA